MDAIYLDHAATTPVRGEVLDAMLPFYGERFGNPSSAHAWGRTARAALEEARERAAATIGARRPEIVFTSGGTEADNLAILGRARCALREGGAALLACSAVEHKAVLAAVNQGVREGATSLIIGTDSEARVGLDTVREAIRLQPAVLSIMWVNNEVGSIQPIEQIADLCAEHSIVFHTDAVQAVARINVRVRPGIGLMSLSGHKLGAPKGIGALYVREGVTLVSSQHGGSQERGLRPGTENVAAAIGFARALELAVAERDAEAARLRALRTQLETMLVQNISDVQVNGAGAERAPHITSVAVPGVEQDALLVSLDIAGIAVSTASACQSGASEPSHVLVAMGRNLDNAAVLRVSLGHATTEADVKNAATRLADVITKTRSLAVAAGAS